MEKVIPQHIQQQIVGLRDEQQYHTRRLQDLSDQMSRLLGSLGLREGVELAVIPIQTALEKPEKIEEMKELGGPENMKATSRPG